MATETWNDAAASELRAEMARQRASVADLSSASGVEKTSVYRKTRGTRAITVDEFAAMVTALGTTPSEFMERVELAHKKNNRQAVA